MRNGPYLSESATARREDGYRPHAGGQRRDLFRHLFAFGSNLGNQTARRSVAVTLADGRRVRLGADLAVIKIDGREAPTTILVGNVDEPILGVEALEALGLAVDPAKKRLTPSRPYAVRLGGCR